MPDAGEINHDHQGHDLPQDWAGAFAALPQDVPAEDGWQRLQAHLPKPTRRLASPRRTRWPLWLAAAASLVLAVAIPLRMQPDGSPEPMAMLLKQPDAATPAVIDASTDTVVPTISTASQPETNHASRPTPATTARVDKPRPSKHVNPSQRPIRTAAQPAGTTRVAAIDPADGSVAAASTSLEPARVQTPNLEPLYAQSAQLEGLLALARDEHVANGTTAALIDNLDARVADIDAVLAQPDVSPEHRGNLWRDRVDILRQLVGIESTQRLYSARGQQYDAALVSID